MSLAGVRRTQEHVSLYHKRYILYNKMIYITNKSIFHYFYSVLNIYHFLFILQLLQTIHSMTVRKDHRLSVDVNFSIALETRKKKL